MDSDSEKQFFKKFIGKIFVTNIICTIGVIIYLSIVFLLCFKYASFQEISYFEDLEINIDKANSNYDAAMTLDECVCNSSLVIDGEYPQKAQVEDAEEKYALIVISDTSEFTLKENKEKSKQKYINGIWLDAPYVYTSLKEIGFKPENIKVLTSESNPDFNESQMVSALHELKEEQFNGSYNNTATIANIINAIDELDIGREDTFVFVVTGHGDKNYISLEADSDDIYAEQLHDIFKNTKPNKGLIFIDSCGSGELASKLSLDDYVVISSVVNDSIGFADRYFSNVRTFFQNLNTMSTDENHDGKISLKEAVYKTRKDALAYHGVKKYQTSVKMQMFVGKKTSADMWLANWNYPLDK